MTKCEALSEPEEEKEKHGDFATATWQVGW